MRVDNRLKLGVSASASVLKLNSSFSPFDAVCYDII